MQIANPIRGSPPVSTLETREVRTFSHELGPGSRRFLSSSAIGFTIALLSLMAGNVQNFIF